MAKLETYKGVNIYTDLRNECENASFVLNGKFHEVHDLIDARRIIDGGA